MIALSTAAPDIVRQVGRYLATGIVIITENVSLTVEDLSPAVTRG